MCAVSGSRIYRTQRTYAYVVERSVRAARFSRQAVVEGALYVPRFEFHTACFAGWYVGVKPHRRFVELTAVCVEIRYPELYPRQPASAVVGYEKGFAGRPERLVVARNVDHAMRWGHRVGGFRCHGRCWSRQPRLWPQTAPGSAVGSPCGGNDHGCESGDRDEWPCHKYRGVAGMAGCGMILKHICAA